MEVQRDNDGWWTHPDMPEVETSEQFNAWQEQQGFQLCIVMLDGDAGDGTEEAYKTYFDAANADCSAWQPSKPEGDGWFIVSIHDTEDGPACIWIRHPTEEQLREAQARIDADSKPDMGEVSDGYHTFNELYAHRVRLFSTLMRAHPDKSWWSFNPS